MTRAIVGVLDSLGIGAADDAADFGDVGANTFGHIADVCAAGVADRSGVRAGPLTIPHLSALGLVRAAETACGRALPIAPPTRLTGCFGYAAEVSSGKDTPSGHWEMMGLPVTQAWGYFPPDFPSAPASVTEPLIAQGGLPGILGNYHASGTQIIADLGAAHIHTGMPILYTSGDSVLQIAADEDSFTLERLYDLCAIARRLVDPHNIGRVIARPFVATAGGQFVRTGNRRDLATPPHAPTLLNHVVDGGGTVIGVGKISDIFAGSGITANHKAHGNDEVMDRLLEAIATAPDGGLVFANFCDFDTLYGHRRDVVGYAAALEAFDRRLPQLQNMLQPGDICVLSADHGCDPTWPGSDHTREYVPVLTFGPQVAPRDIGRRSSFADIGQSLAVHLQTPKLAHGIAFL